MTSPTPEPHDLTPFIEHFFRAEYGRLVATLTRMFRFDSLDTAEDLVQETLLTACRQWSFGTVPDNPHGWLMTVARNKALNLIKHGKRSTAAHQRIRAEGDARERADPEQDSTLAMMFACCHPALDQDDQIALVLKILCGFSVGEIARALLLKEEATAKRIYRAKKRLRASGIRFELPVPSELDARIDAVCRILYLLYNEGYHSSQDGPLIRKDVCFEAMRLTKKLVEGAPDHRQVPALLALMCFHTARFDSRIDEQGSLILLADQDRSTWHPVLNQAGVYYLSEAAQGPSLSRYHLEASIAAEHATAASFDDTNWGFIRSLYERLLAIDDNPVIELNLAVVTSRIEGNVAAIEQLENIRQSGRLDRYPLLEATLGELYRLEQRPRKAISHFQAALTHRLSQRVAAHIADRIDELTADLNDAPTMTG